MKNNVDFFFHFSDFTLNENLYPLKKHSSFYYIVRGVYYFTRSFVYSLIYGNYKYKEINSVKGKILFFCLSLNNRRALSSVMDKFDKQDYHLLGIFENQRMAYNAYPIIDLPLQSTGL